MEYDISAIVSMIIRSLTLKKKDEVAEFLNKAVDFDLKFQDHDNWNGGIDFYILIFYFNFDQFVLNSDKRENYTAEAYEALNDFYHDEQNVIQGIVFEAQIIHYFNWKNIPLNIKKKDILSSIKSEMEILIDVGTGKILIKGTDADAKYKEMFRKNTTRLQQLGILRSQSYPSLWEWYNYYSHSLSAYQDRRVYIHSIYDPLISQIEESIDSREQEMGHTTILQLQETMPTIQELSHQAFEEFGRAIKSIKDANDSIVDERARKDAVRSVASAMEAVIKVLGGTDDIKSSSRLLRDAHKWGPDEIVKEGDAIFNTLHRIYPDLRHGSLETSTMSFEESEYWISRMTNYISYMQKKNISM